MLGHIIPSHFFSSIQKDFLQVYRRGQLKAEIEKSSADQTNSSTNMMEAQLLKLRAKTYLAGYRLIGAGFLGVSCLLTSYIILPLISLKVVAGLAAAVASYVLGHDLFCIFKAREANKENSKQEEISSTISFKTFLKTRSIEPYLNETFLPASFWKSCLETKV